MTTESADPNTIVYFNGRFVPLSEANVSILTHGLHYGTGVFEGIRGYWAPHMNDLFLVRAVEHYQRWKANGSIVRIDILPTAPQLAELTAELCRLNEFHTNIYVRPIAYKSSARVGVAPDANDALSIIAMPFGDYIASENGLHAGVTSWRRIEDSAIPARAKICGSYVNSVLATDEARRNGYDEAIFLTGSGHIAEGATCNIFILRNGKLITPPPTDNILEGITRASVIELARHELGLEVIERSIARSEMYVAEEAFFTGTAVEVAPITWVDRRRIGKGEVGPTTERLRNLYREATRGHLPQYHHWLAPVYRATTPGREVLHASGTRDRFIGITVGSR
jgi:branched-chain amino acid aminotransferase